MVVVMITVRIVTIGDGVCDYNSGGGGGGGT